MSASVTPARSAISTCHSAPLRARHRTALIVGPRRIWDRILVLSQRLSPIIFPLLRTRPALPVLMSGSGGRLTCGLTRSGHLIHQCQMRRLKLLQKRLALLRWAPMKHLRGPSLTSSLTKELRELLMQMATHSRSTASSTKLEALVRCAAICIATTTKRSFSVPA